MESITKKCRVCGETKPVTEFCKNSPLSNYKTIYRNDCKSCKAKEKRIWRASNLDRAKEIAQKSYNKNIDKNRQSARDKTKKIRMEAIGRYGGKCACCGEKRYEFLALDHINGNGSQERKALGNKARGIMFYWYLKSLGWPEGYRILCHNCNVSLGLYGYCPHAEG